MNALNQGHEVVAIVPASRMLSSIGDLFAIYRLVVLSYDAGVFRFSSRSVTLCVSVARPA